MPESPRRDGGVTPRCRGCGAPLPTGITRTHCGPACRQRAYRAFGGRRNNGTKSIGSAVAVVTQNRRVVLDVAVRMLSPAQTAVTLLSRVSAGGVGRLGRGRAHATPAHWWTRPGEDRWAGPV